MKTVFRYNLQRRSSKLSKTPKIANVFSQMGIVEELGSGVRKMFKYTPLYANGKEPIIEEQDERTKQD